MTENELKKGNELKRKIDFLKIELKNYIEFKKEFFKNSSRVEIRKDGITFGYYNDTKITDKDIVNEFNDKINDIINNKLKKLNQDIEEQEKIFKKL